MSVESVGLELPSIFSVSGSPVTTTGTLEGELVSQPANSVFAGPISGVDDVPTFRPLDEADLPIATTTSLGAVSIGGGLSVTGGGVLSADTPVIATTSSVGVVSVGSGLSVTGGGVLSADVPAIATTSSVGVVSVGTGLSVTGGGILSADAPAIATTSSVGVVSVGNGLTVTGAGVLSRSDSYSVGVPALSSFTKVNQSSFSISEVAGSSITASGPGAASWNLCLLYKAAPTPPYRLAAFISIGAALVPYFGSGLAFYDPATSKFVEIFFCVNLNKVCNIQISKWNSPTSFNSSPIVWPWTMNSGGFWLGLRDDGTNVYYEFSGDGANFATLYTEAKASGFLAGAYGNNAFVINPNTGGASNTINSTLFVWDPNGLGRAPVIL